MTDDQLLWLARAFEPITQVSACFDSMADAPLDEWLEAVKADVDRAGAAMWRLLASRNALPAWAREREGDAL